MAETAVAASEPDDDKPKEVAKKQVPRHLDRARSMANLFVAGYSLAQIADQYDVTPKEAESQINALLALTFDPKADYNTLRALKVEQYNQLLRSVWPLAISRTIGDKPNDQHLWYNKRAQEILEGQAKLLGLNAAIQVAIQDPTREELSAIVDRLVALERSGGDEEFDILDMEEGDDGTYYPE